MMGRLPLSWLLLKYRLEGIERRSGLGKLKETLNEKKILFDVINVIIGVGMLVLIGLFILFPGNGLILVMLFIAGGFINLSNGLKLYQDKRKKTAGMAQICLGIIIITLALYFIKMGVVTAG